MRIQGGDFLDKYWGDPTGVSNVCYGGGTGYQLGVNGFTGNSYNTAMGVQALSGIGFAGMADNTGIGANVAPILGGAPGLRNLIL